MSKLQKKDCTRVVFLAFIAGLRSSGATLAIGELIAGATLAQ
jgi:hypothetical protein